ncbi:MAG: hypothetical protein NBV67_15760 [Tagaea sp.]|nr:hypothetical protein [Tagaea sp.]
MDIKAKAVVALERALAEQGPDARVRAIVTLAAPASAGRIPEGKAVRFANRQEMRRAAIDGQRAANNVVVSAMRPQLESLGLDVRGGELAPVLIVEGRLADVSRALSVPGVAHAELDREIDFSPGPPRPF